MTTNTNNIRKSFLYCLEVLIFIGLGQIAGTLILEVVIKGILKLINSPLLNDPAFLTFSDYIVFIGIWIVFFSYYSGKNKEKVIKDVLGRKCHGNTFMCFVIGLLIGFSTNFICGYLALKHGDIVIDYIGFKPLETMVVFLAVLVQSGAEELLCRGLLYQKLRRRYGDGLRPIIISSMLFACLHLFNEGITLVSFLNLILAGILPALMIYYFDSMWMCIAEHTAWNFTQNILLGLPNSGIRVPFSIFVLRENMAHDSFFYNVGFGIEGSAISLIVLLMFIVVLVLTFSGRRKPGYDVWQGITEDEIEKDQQEKADAKMLKKIKKYTARDYRKKLRKNPDYTYSQLLEYELVKEDRSIKRQYPTMAVILLTTLGLYLYVLPGYEPKQLVSVLVGEVLGMAVALPMSRKQSKRRKKLLNTYLSDLS